MTSSSLMRILVSLFSQQQLGYPRAGLAYGPRPEDDYTEYSDSRYTGDNDQIGPRLMGALFVGFGTLLLALAIIEVMLCIEHGYYCLFWTGALVGFAIFFFSILCRSAFNAAYSHTNSSLVSFTQCIATSGQHNFSPFSPGMGRFKLFDLVGYS